MLLSNIWSVLVRKIATAVGRDDILSSLANIERKIELLEYFSHGARATYVGNNRVLVKCVVAQANIAYFVEADDRLLSPWFIVTGGYETLLTDFFVGALKPDSFCIDVGANFGYFTCLMARFCPHGRVIGIEADEHVYEIARDNVFINGFQGFTRVVHAAASDANSILTLYRRKTRSANTSIAKLPPEFIESMGETASEAFEVASLRVDSLLPEMNGHVDFLKIDVEGAEPLVFQGAQETIARNPNLNIVMEWSPGQIQAAGFDVGEFVNSLRELKLQPYNVTSTALLPLTFEQLANTDYRAGVVLKRSAE